MGELKTELKEEREAREQAERKADAAIGHVRQLWERIETIEDNNSHALNLAFDQIRDVREQIEDNEPTKPHESAPEDPPIYDLCKTPDDCLSANERRTKTLWTDLEDYTTLTPKGRIITGPDLIRVLRAAQDDDCETRIESKTAYRVMDLSKTLTREVIDVEKVDGRWRMLVPPDWIERARDAYKYTQNEPAQDAPPSDTAVSTG